MSASGSGGRQRLVRKRLADGTVKVYRYERGGRKKEEPQHRGFERLAMLYIASPEFARNSPGWQRALRKYVAAIDKEIGYMTTADLAGEEARKRFWRLRDQFAATPHKADKVVSTLSLVLGWAYRRGHIAYNHATGIDRLAPPSSTRADIIWTPDDEAAFIENAPERLADAFLLALYTLAREADLCGLRWAQFDGRWLVYKPSKTAHSTAPTIHLPVYRLEPLKALLGRLPRECAHILTAKSGIPWRPANLSHQFERRRAICLLSHSGLRWHDIRGTGITRLYNAGCTDAEVASISGHVMGARAQQRSYIARTRELAENAYAKWDRAMQAGGQVIRLHV